MGSGYIYTIYTYKSRTVGFLHLFKIVWPFEMVCRLSGFSTTSIFFIVAKPWTCSAIFSRLKSRAWCTHTEIYRDNIFLGNTHADLLKMLGQRVKHIILGGGLMVIYHGTTFKKKNTLNQSKALEKCRWIIFRFLQAWDLGAGSKRGLPIHLQLDYYSWWTKILNPELYLTLFNQKIERLSEFHLVSPDFSFNWLVLQPLGNGNPLLNLLGTVRFSIQFCFIFQALHFSAWPQW